MNRNWQFIRRTVFQWLPDLNLMVFVIENFKLEVYLFLYWRTSRSILRWCSKLKTSIFDEVVRVLGEWKEEKHHRSFGLNTILLIEQLLIWFLSYLKLLESLNLINQLHFDQLQLINSIHLVAEFSDCDRFPLARFDYYWSGPVFLSQIFSENFTEHSLNRCALIFGLRICLQGVRLLA